MKREFWFSITASLCLLCVSVQAGDVCPFCEIRASERDEVLEELDAALELTEAEKANTEQRHFRWGRPSGPPNSSREQLLHNAEYIINYDGDLRVPLWAAYRLKREDITSRTRTDCFRQDPRLDQSDASRCDDYVDNQQDPSDFDRGHLVPRADMNRSRSAMLNTFLLSNMMPQHDRFNRDIWARLECLGREWANETGEIIVFTGAVFDRDFDGRRDGDDSAKRMRSDDGNMRVAVPTAFYKIFLHERDNGFVESMAFLLPHIDSTPAGGAETIGYLKGCLVPIAQIRHVTGVDFIPNMAPAKKKAVELARRTDLWSLPGTLRDACSRR